MAKKRKIRTKAPGLNGHGGARPNSGPRKGQMKKQPDLDDRLKMSAQEVLKSIGCEDPLVIVGRLAIEAEIEGNAVMRLACARELLRYCRPTLTAMAFDHNVSKEITIRLFDPTVDDDPANLDRPHPPGRPEPTFPRGGPSTVIEHQPTPLRTITPSHDPDAPVWPDDDGPEAA